MTASNPDPRSPGAGMPDEAGNGTTKQRVNEEAQDAKREVGDKARRKAQTGKHRLADEAGTLSGAIDAAASNLDDHDRQGLARYARELSGNLANAAGRIEGHSVDELANDAKRLARNNPALFVLGSIAVGFGLSRFFKASAERDHDDHDTLRDDDVAIGTPVQGHEQSMAETNATSARWRNGDERNML